MGTTWAPSTVRLAEVLAALSLASDVGHDQPLEKSLRNAVIAARLGDELDLPAAELSAVYYVALLRSMGCTGNSHATAVLLGGDDRAFLGLVQALGGGDGREWARGLARAGRALGPDLAPARDEAGSSPRASRGPPGARLGLRGLDRARPPGRPAGRRPGRARAGLRALGRAGPGDRRRGPVRGGADLPRRRRGRDRHAGRRRRRPCASWSAAGRAATSTRRSPRSSPPGGRPARRPRRCRHARRRRSTPSRRRSRAASRDGARRAARAIADFADLKSPWTLGHSPAVAELAGRRPRGDEDRETLRLAGLLHDLGRVAVPNGIWDRPAASDRRSGSACACTPTTPSASSPARRVFADLARARRVPSRAARRDRLPPRARRATRSPTPMRVLAVADAYAAMTADRPHRAGPRRRGGGRELQPGRAPGRAVRPSGRRRARGRGPRAGARRRPRAASPSARSRCSACSLAASPTRRSPPSCSLPADRPAPRRPHLRQVDRRTRAGAAMFAMEHRLL